MFCPRCGQAITAQDEFCKMCGHNLGKATTTSYNEEAKMSNASMVLLGMGVAIAVLICVISIGAYGRVYFFDGYAITKFAWIAAIGCVVCGLVAFVKDILAYGISALLEDDKIRFCAAVLLICVIPAIFLFAPTKKTGSISSNGYDYYDSPDYYQNTYESCHSTYEHKQAIYSYDLNDDNYLSEYEIDLFLKAHPNVFNDKQFMEWVEDHLG